MEEDLAHGRNNEVESRNEALKTILAIAGFAIEQDVVVPKMPNTREIGIIGKISGVGILDKDGRALPAVEVTYEHFVGAHKEVTSSLVLLQELTRCNPFTSSDSTSSQPLPLEQRLNQGPFHPNFVRKHTHREGPYSDNFPSHDIRALNDALRELETNLAGLTLEQISREISDGQREMYQNLFMNLGRVVAALEEEARFYQSQALTQRDSDVRFWENSIIESRSKQLAFEAKYKKLQKLFDNHDGN